MKSTILYASSYGQANVLDFATQELPQLAEGMARIQVKAAGINPIDARRMTGEFKHAPMPQTFGTEFAGVIIETGASSENWSVGDEVLGSGGHFTHATVIDVPLGNLVARPQSIAWEVGGTLAGVSQTAMTILDEIGDVRSLLIHGASGGVGSITVQLAIEKGIQVVATASEKNIPYLKNLGAIAVAYGPGLLHRLKELGIEPFDAAIDMSGTDEAIEVSLQTVKPNGFIGSIAGKPICSPRVKAVWVKRNVSNLRFVVEGIASGKFKWTIDSSFPFANAPQAYSKILDGHTKGKIALIF